MNIHRSILYVKFESDYLANIALNSINADPVPNPEFVSRIIETQGDNLKCTIECEDLFKLRTSLNNYIEALLQIQKTIDKFRID